MFRFEKFEVWHEAIAFADHIYRLTDAFPIDERFGLTSQMRRAAVSISSNIAEGTSRNSSTDFARFVEIAYGSLMEVISQAHIATRRQIVNEKDLASLRDCAEGLARMLSGLRASLVS